MSIFQSIQRMPPMAFTPPPMPQGLPFNPIAAAQAAAQAQAQEALKNGGVGNGAAPAGSYATNPVESKIPVGGAQGGSVSPSAASPAAAAQSGLDPGMMAKISQLFGGSGGGFASLAQLMSVLG